MKPLDTKDAPEVAGGVRPRDGVGDCTPVAPLPEYPRFPIAPVMPDPDFTDPNEA